MKYASITQSAKGVVTAGKILHLCINLIVMVFYTVNVLFLKDDMRVGIWCIYVVWVTKHLWSSQDFWNPCRIAPKSFWKCGRDGRGRRLDLHGSSTQDVFLFSFFLLHQTLTRFLSCVCPYLHNQVALLSKLFVTLLTLKWFPCVKSCVRLHAAPAAAGWLEAKNAIGCFKSAGLQATASDAGAAWSRRTYCLLNWCPPLT